MVQVHNTIVETALDGSGNVISGAKLFIYEAGTTSKLTTFSDSALTTPNTNPLIADSAGRFTTIYGNPDDYKFVLAPANDTDPPTSAIVTTDDYTIAASTSFSGGINSSGETEHLVSAQTGTSYTVLDSDRAKLVTHNNVATIAVTLPQAQSLTFEAGWYYDTFVTGAGTVTITPTTSTINGLATLTLPANSGCKIVSDGTNYQIEGLYSINPGVNAQTGTSYTVAADDLNKLVTFSNVSAIAATLPQANATTFKSGWKFTATNISTGAVTFTPTTSTIDGAATFVLKGDESIDITSDGTNYRTSFASIIEPTLPNGGYATNRFQFGGLVAPTSSIALAVDTLYGLAFVVSETETFTRIGIRVVSTGTATLARLGIYNHVGQTPTTLVLDAGTIDVTGTGDKEITISQRLTQGSYILAAVANGTVSFLQSISEPSILTHYFGGSDSSTTAKRVIAAHSFAALPDPYPTVTYEDTNSPSMYLRKV